MRVSHRAGISVTSALKLWAGIASVNSSSGELGALFVREKRTLPKEEYTGRVLDYKLVASSSQFRMYEFTGHNNKQSPVFSKNSRVRCE